MEHEESLKLQTICVYILRRSIQSYTISYTFILYIYIYALIYIVVYSSSIDICV